MNIKAITLSALTTLAAVSTSYAATISISGGDYDTQTGTLSPGGSILYTFFAEEDVTLTVAYAVTGLIGDLNNVSYGTAEHENSFTQYTGLGAVFAGFATIEYTLSSGETLSLGFFDGITRNVGTSLTYSVTSIPSVPLPAAGFLMLGGLAALGAVAKRRKH
ncbi:MAG TPA: VPLPA-CTERM sorting domain-containing protein [Paenirhodobacter sp.]